MFPTLLSAAVVLTGGAPAPKEKAKPDPTPVGMWVPESVTVGGRPSEPGADWWEFRSDGTWTMLNRGNVIATGSFTNDPKASPPALDIAESTARWHNLCRYKLDEDTLTLSVGHDSSVRPADTQPGPRATVWVLKRLKDK